MTNLDRRLKGLSPERHALLALRLKEKRQATPEKQTIPRRKDTDDLPLSFAQERLWFLNQLELSATVYSELSAFRLIGPLDHAALERSLNAIVQRHEALRTMFVSVDGQPRQAITPSLTVEVPVVILHDLPKREREAQVQELAKAEAQQPYDLAQGPLFQAKLLRLGAEEHVLLLAMPHIIGDGWSMTVFIREMAVFYEAFCAGKAASLPELPIQYADFAIWQRQWLRGEILETQLDYWRKQLSGNLTTLELPTDRPRAPVRSSRGAQEYFQLPPSLSESLLRVSQQAEATLFMTLLAAFKTLLYRYTGQVDILVGSPIYNRNRSELEPLIGFFINTLVFRTGLSGTPTFADLLKRIRKITLDAYAHQDLPFEKLIAELRVERNLSYNPLFQVMFVLHNAPMPTLKFSNLTMQWMLIDSGTAKFDLDLAMVDVGKHGLVGWLEYNTELFDSVTITRMIGHFQTLLESIVANPNQRLAELELLTEVEYRHLLLTWNDTQTDYPQDICVHRLFEAQVERTPDAVALVFESESLTYLELNQRANQLAHHLRALGVGPETLVAICMERSIDVGVGLLGILKTGGGFVPLDPDYPKERLTFMLEDTRAPVLLTQQRLVESFPMTRDKVVCLDSDWETIAQESGENPVNEATADNLAYVIYTSGSTGQPKGVVIAHQAIGNHLLWRQQTYPLTTHDRFLHKASLSFDISVWEIFAPLIAGARLILARPGGQMDSAYLVRLIADQKITNIHFPPTMLQLFLEEKGVTECSSLQRVFCGGESMPIELKDHFFERLDAELHHQYGPTETTVDVIIRQCKPTDNRAVVPIGHPIANTKIYILDANLQLVPIGVFGELHVGGLSLARGYLNRSNLTGEKFIADPFSAEPGARLYKTGDIGRYLLDGNIEFLGRRDHQVKIRGFRIELGEIEAILRQHPAIREAVVIVQEDEPGGKRLVTYLVPDQEQPLSTSELRAYLKRKLPDYMIPAVFVALEAMPLNANGKINRRALPALDQIKLESEVSFVAPRTTTEEMLTEIWTEILHVEQVGIYDNFFELGGHSLLATQLISRIRTAFTVEIPLRSLFESPTVAQLATLITRQKAEQVESDKLMQLLAELEELSPEDVQCELENNNS
ncbi:amino acid adenylation domain-containing protein [Chloroflexota bacterium]